MRLNFRPHFFVPYIILSIYDKIHLHRWCKWILCLTDMSISRCSVS